MAKYGWDPHVGRLLGSFFDPNFMGGFLSLVLALVLSLLTSKKGYYRGLLTVFAAGLFIAIILTFSRSSYLALAGVVFVIGLFRARWLIVIGTAAFLVALLFIPRIEARITEGPSPGDSAYFRFITWGNALKVFESSPITGVGFNSYRYAQERLNIAPTDLAGNSGAGSDSSSLLVLATTGVLGFSAFLYLLFRIAQLGWRNMRRGGDIGLALLASLAGLALHSQFVNSFFYIWIMAWFWILVGLTEGEREEIK